jgi:hypothetical protein
MIAENILVHLSQLKVFIVHGFQEKDLDIEEVYGFNDFNATYSNIKTLQRNAYSLQRDRELIMDKYAGLENLIIAGDNKGARPPKTIQISTMVSFLEFAQYLRLSRISFRGTVGESWIMDAYYVSCLNKPPQHMIIDFVKTDKRNETATDIFFQLSIEAASKVILTYNSSQSHIRTRPNKKQAITSQQPNARIDIGL